jgi:hypothetical protein
MIWPDLPNEIKDNSKYINAVEKTKNTIYFFIHEQLNIERYINDIKDILEND